MSSDFGHPPSGHPQGWPAPGHAQAGPPPDAGSSRHSGAFWLTVAATALAWICLAAVVLVTAVGNGDPAELPGATGEGGRADREKGQQVGGEWTVEALLPALQGHADDEYSGDDVSHAFENTWGAMVPCGGPRVQGMAHDVLETTAGGYKDLASAQVLPGPDEAERELARQAEILQGCTAGFDLRHSEGYAFCVPSIQTSTPVVRYREACDGFTPYSVAIFRADNAVVTITTGDNTTMDWMLPKIMSELDAG